MDRRKETPLPPDLANAVLLSSPSADEIGLIDIWTAVIRHKILIVALVVGSMAVGLAFAFFAPRIYEYTTIIEIGTRYFGGRSELVESIETARAKLTGGYIAQTLQEYVANSNDTKRYEIKVEVPKNSQVLILASRGTRENENTYLALHEAVVRRLGLDHLRVQEALRKDLETRLELQQSSLAELRQQANLFNAQLERLDGKGRLPVTELSYLTTLRLADNQRAQAEIIALIDNVRLQLANMRETKAVVSPMRSFEPVGLGKEVRAALGALVGLVLGIVVAVLLEATRKVRDHVDRVVPAT